MRPDIQFHKIVKIQLTEIKDFTSAEMRGTCQPFVSRRMIFSDKDGETFTITLFGSAPNDLRIDLDAMVK